MISQFEQIQNGRRLKEYRDRRTEYINQQYGEASPEVAKQILRRFVVELAEYFNYFERMKELGEVI
ncbi:MAG: hypothetical protein U9Q06_02680 [Nanoarchaeota archaeon]|nr:hypothetical protein [Nanoarchaeota archaeon]